MRFSQNRVFQILEMFLWHLPVIFFLLFGDCATLMSKSVLSRGFFKVCIFWSRNYGNMTFWHIVEPPYIFFNILYSKQSLHWLYSACKVWKSLDSSFLRYPFWKDFGTVVFGLKFRHFEFFYCKNYVLLDTMFHIHYFTAQKSIINFTLTLWPLFMDGFNCLNARATSGRQFTFHH